MNYARVQRVHEDDSVVVKYYDNKGAGNLPPPGRALLQRARSRDAACRQQRLPDNCSAEGGTWSPDLRTRQVVWGAGVLVKF